MKTKVLYENLNKDIKSLAGKNPTKVKGGIVSLVEECVAETIAGTGLITNSCKLFKNVEGLGEIEIGYFSPTYKPDKRKTGYNKYGNTIEKVDFNYYDYTDDCMDMELDEFIKRKCINHMEERIQRLRDENKECSDAIAQNNAHISDFENILVKIEKQGLK